MKSSRLLIVISILAILATVTLAQQAAATKPGLLTAEEVKALMPETVFFAGQRAPVQMRNAAGIRSQGGKLVLTGLVDNSGYSTGIAQKYQAYLITEVKLQVGDATLAPGAYGCGFAGGKFVVMDIAGSDATSTPEQMDDKLKRPRPLMITLQSDGVYRLYLGKRYVVLSMAR